jgi:hypothetical protein
VHRAAAPVLVQCVWQRPSDGDRLEDALIALGAQRAEDVALAESLLIVTNGPRDPAPRGPRAGARSATLGRAEIAGRLDALPALRRTMPSVLGVRDLEDLIDPAIGQRSTLDRDSADSLARVFVPTRAYARALVVLNRHHFAVLTGSSGDGQDRDREDGRSCTADRRLGGA